MSQQSLTKRIVQGLKENGIELNETQVNEILSVLNYDSSMLVPANLSNIVTAIKAHLQSSGALAAPTAPNKGGKVSTSRSSRKRTEPEVVRFDMTSTGRGIQTDLTDILNTAEDVAEEVSDEVAVRVEEKMLSIPQRALTKVQTRMTEYGGRPETFRNDVRAGLIEALLPRQ